jgi:hypothetical protein
VDKKYNASNMSAIVNKIIERSGEPALLSLLTEQLSGSELNSLLLEVFKLRAKDMTPAELLALYQKNRFVKPGDLPVIALRKMELDLLELFDRSSFTPIELSPVTALGSCSVVAPADQKKILSALRGTEVLADATNSIALHVSDLKKIGQWIPSSPNERIRFSNIQRHLRTQAISGKGFTPHFKIGCLVTCGSDTGSFAFEKESLCEHMALMTSLYRDYYKVEDVRFRFICREGYPDSFALAKSVRDFVVDQLKDIVIDIVQTPEKVISYYKGIQYKIDIRVNGKQFEIGDGGFVDWTQQLMQNKKERMLSTGIGFEFMYRIMQGAL